MSFPNLVYIEFGPLNSVNYGLQNWPNLPAPSSRKKRAEKICWNITDSDMHCPIVLRAASSGSASLSAEISKVL